ncbi:MAG: hypothetical protein ACI9QL_000767 [Candidatus Omnitrophota bacterium]|jgi:hypothetical protein
MINTVFIRMCMLTFLALGFLGCASSGRVRPEYLVGLPVNNAIKQFGLTRYERWQAPQRAKGLDSELRYFTPEGDILIRFDANGIIRYSNFQENSLPPADRKQRIQQDWTRWDASQRRRFGNRVPADAQFSSFPDDARAAEDDTIDYPGKGIPGANYPGANYPGANYPGSQDGGDLPGTDYPGKELEPPGSSTPNRYGNPNFPDLLGNQNVTERFPDWNDPATRRPGSGF